jgi:hypothetical protein
LLGGGLRFCPYKEVSQSDNPAKVLMDFIQSTYNAAADLANWDKRNLELQVNSKH